MGMNDAKGCYDRIAHAVGILVLMSFGVPAIVCQVLLSSAESRAPYQDGLRTVGCHVWERRGTSSRNLTG